MFLSIEKYSVALETPLAVLAGSSGGVTVLGKPSSALVGPEFCVVAEFSAEVVFPGVGGFKSESAVVLFPGGCNSGVVVPDGDGFIRESVVLTGSGGFVCGYLSK